MTEESTSRWKSRLGVVDAIVIGSGFGGAITACRLAQAGLAVHILERGRRFRPAARIGGALRASHPSLPVYPVPPTQNVPPDLPREARDTGKSDVTRMFWALGNGVWDFRNLGDVLVGQAAGYGGGSLIYANVHMRPPEHAFDERWPVKRGELERHFDLVAKNLRVTLPPEEHEKLPKRVQLERAATELGKRRGASGKNGDPS